MACHAFETLNQRRQPLGVERAGLTLVFDQWDLKPGLIELAQRFQLGLTSVCANNEVVT